MATTIPSLCRTRVKRERRGAAKLAGPLIAASWLIAGWTLAADTRSGGNVVFTTEIYDAGGARTSGGAVVNDGSLGGIGDQVTGGGVTINGGYPAQLPSPAPPPTAATLLSFDARWTRAGEVALEWQTGVEFDLLGFQLQRQEANGEWLGVNAGIIPSVGTGQPNRYRFVEPTVPAAGIVRYRLLEVDQSGQLHVVAETVAQVGLHAGIALTPSGLTIWVQGRAGPAVVETATDVAHGPWQPVSEPRLDAAGQAVLQVPMAEAGSARFYRVRQE